VALLPTPSPTEIILPWSESEEGEYVVDIDKVTEDSWSLFGTINVANYRFGYAVGRDTNGYEPFYIVNRYNETSEELRITTEVGETTADIPINQLLHNGDIASMIGIESDLYSDELVVIGYVAETNSLTITGFTPNTTRIATIAYIPDTVFKVTFTNNQNTLRTYNTSATTTNSGSISVLINDLLDDDIANINSIKSDLVGDVPVCSVYTKETNELIITGLIPDEDRKISINYDSQVAKLIPYFALEQDTITVAPDSYEPIHYSFMIPDSIELPDSFSVWIYAEASYVYGTGIGFNIGYYAPIKITMTD
jgi:hypothetical protein